MNVIKEQTIAKICVLTLQEALFVDVRVGIFYTMGILVLVCTSNIYIYCYFYKNNKKYFQKNERKCRDVKNPKGM